MDSTRNILQFLHYHPNVSRQEIAEGIGFQGSDATLKRLIAKEVQIGNIIVEGKARATCYQLSPQAHRTMPLNIDTYFLKEADERLVQTSFNFELITGQLPQVKIFSDDEIQRLNVCQNLFREHIADMYVFATGEYF